MSTGPGPALLVHGGAWDIPLAETEDHLRGMERAAAAGRAILEQGGSALDAVTAAVIHMENSGVFDAGCGSVLTAGGIVEMDAGVMCGERLAFGSVAAVRRTANPVQAARRLLDGSGEVRLLVGEAADAMAEAAGLRTVEGVDLIHPRERARHEAISRRREYHTSESFVGPSPRGTVGCVARDVAGRLAAATSTGGTPGRPEGRVGDSPLPGSGFYADSLGAASATGWGEAIASAILCSRAVEAVSRGSDPEAAAREELARMSARIRNPQGDPAAAGLILLAESGAGAWAFNTPRMARAGWSAGSGAWSRLDPRR